MLIPGGAQTLSKQRGRFPSAYPRSLVRGRGARVQDAEGRTYTDWICALGAISLGYQDDAVQRAVHRQVHDGPIFSLPNVALEERVAQRLVDLVPCAESVRFFKTGSECTEAAVRVARAATTNRRFTVISCGYHGWHSMWAALHPEHPGVPWLYETAVSEFSYNDIASLDAAIERELGGDSVAAIILEPTLVEPPEPGFLEGVRERAARIGAVLIFDEMVTGFRWHAGGAQALYGVTPDLACFGKGMGNGYPVAALVGRADLMSWARLASGTFGGDCVGLAAADATLARYQAGAGEAVPDGEGRQVGRGHRVRDAVTAHMWRLGADLIDGYNGAAGMLAAPTRMVGQPPHPVVRWDEAPDGTGPNRWRASLFFQEVVRRGHLVHPEGLNLMLAHTGDDARALLAACEAAMVEVVAAIRSGTVRERIEGEPIDPRPAWRVTR